MITLFACIGAFLFCALLCYACIYQPDRDQTWQLDDRDETPVLHPGRYGFWGKGRGDD